MSPDDPRWMGAALALARRGLGRTAPNPTVGCLIIRGGHVVGRGWTQPGGRPHAEAMALQQAGAAAKGATAYVTLEPCAHEGGRGPACAGSLIKAGIARAVVAMIDPDRRTAGKGIEQLRQAGIDVDVGVAEAEARLLNAGFVLRQTEGRPFITLKLAMSIDGRIALPNGESRWITGETARRHAHLERACHDAILVGRGTFEADAPRLDVRLPGLEGRSPRRFLLSRTLETADSAFSILRGIEAIDDIPGVTRLLVEGGAGVAAAFLAADRVDRLVVYRAPIILGTGRPAIDDIGLADLASAHGRWKSDMSHALGSDRLDVYNRAR